VGSFISEDESKIIVQIFNEGSEKDFSIDVPLGSTSVERFLTSNNESEEFLSMGTSEIDYYNRYFTTTLPELSLTSLVFNIDESLSNNGFTLIDNNEFNVIVFPNPFEDNLNLILPEHSDYQIKIYDLKGSKLFDNSITNKKEVLLDISQFQKGTYLVNITSLSNQKTITKKIIKQ